MTMLNERLYTLEEIADRYRYTPRAVRAWKDNGFFSRYVRVGRKVLIPESVLLEFEQQHTYRGRVDAAAEQIAREAEAQPTGGEADD